MAKPNKRKRRKRIQKAYKSISKEENDACWKWARRMARERRFDTKLVNKKVYCKQCKKYYCLGFDEVDQYCYNCFYKGCCQKEITGGRLCQNCQKH